MPIIIGTVLPWAFIILYQIGKQKIEALGKLDNHWLLGSGINNSLALSVGLFAFGACELAQAIFHTSFAPAYILMLVLFAMFLLIAHVYYFRDIIYMDYAKVYLRFVSYITVILNLFFTVVYIINLMVPII